MDESGEVTNEKTVGYFKGRVRIRNEAEHEEHTKIKEEKMEQIFDLIRQLH